MGHEPHAAPWDKRTRGTRARQTARRISSSLSGRQGPRHQQNQYSVEFVGELGGLQNEPPQVNHLRRVRSGAEEIRTPHEFPLKTALLEQGGAESGAPAIRTRPIDPDVAFLIDAWPK